MALSKVKSVTGNGSFENEYGAVQESGKKLLFSFEYEMEDGTILKANHKTNSSPFPGGSEVEYEVTKEHPEHGKSGKVKKPDTGNFQNNTPNAFKGGLKEDARQLMIVRQSSLTRAIEVLEHNATINSGGDDSIDIDPVEVVELAGRFAKWVMQPDKTIDPSQSVMKQPIEDMVKASTIGAEPQPTPPLPVAEEESDDLPF